MVKNKSLVVLSFIVLYDSTSVSGATSQLFVHRSVLGSIALQRISASSSWVDLYADDQITEITLFLRFEKHFRSSKIVSVVCAFMGHREQLLCRMEYFDWNIFYCRSRYADMLHDKDRVSAEAKPF